MNEVKCSESDAESGNLNALLCAIASAEMGVRYARASLLELQHEYLRKVGFDIEPATDTDFVKCHIYRFKDEIFLDADHAIEYVEENT